MKCFAITGGIGCGKSMLARMMADMGCRVLDADDVVHELEAAGGDAVAPIVAAFGRDTLHADGSVDRRRLGRLVFGDAAALERLNAIVHPLVRRRFEAWAAAAGDGIGVGVVPLLFETGWTDPWAGVVCVSCGPDEQVRRLRARGWSDEEIRRRLDAQWPLSEKERRADWVIHNDGSVEQLARNAAVVLRAMMEKVV